MKCTYPLIGVGHVHVVRIVASRLASIKYRTFSLGGSTILNSTYFSKQKHQLRTNDRRAHCAVVCSCVFQAAAVLQYVLEQPTNGSWLQRAS